MHQLTKISQQRLDTCHPDLQRLVYRVLQEIPVLVLCGHRDARAQNEAFVGGFSKLVWPNSKHNKMPSLAVDLAPAPLDWNDIRRFNEMCDIIEMCAEELGIDIRLGRDFEFRDFPHVELA